MFSSVFVFAQSDTISSERKTLFQEVSAAVAAGNTAARAPPRVPPHAPMIAPALRTGPSSHQVQEGGPAAVVPPAAAVGSAGPAAPAGGIEIPKSLAEIYGLSNINRRNRNKEKKRNRASGGEGSLRASADGSEAAVDPLKAAAAAAGAEVAASEVEEFYFGSGADQSAVGSTIDETVRIMTSSSW